MTDPKEHQEDDALDLEAEPIKDLEPDDEAAEDVRGGGSLLPGSSRTT
jgi:hypothetical protein